MQIELTRAVLERISAEAKQAFPEEACGLLLGHGNRIECLRPSRNVDPNPQTHFEIDPQMLVDALRDARQGGLEVVGYYHSHPNGRAEPSVTDRQQAPGDGRVWAIVGDGEVTLWRVDKDGFSALSYTLFDS